MIVALLVIWIVAIPAVVVGVSAWCAWRRERSAKHLAARGLSVVSEFVGVPGVGSTQQTR